MKDGGLIGFIAPNNWITNSGASIFRNFVLDNARILQYVDFGNYNVFETASIQTMIYIMQKTKDNESYATSYSKLNNDKSSVLEVINFLNNKDTNNNTRFIAKIKKTQCFDNYILFLNHEVTKVLNKIQKAGNSFLQKDEIIQGIVGAPDECFIINDMSNFSETEQQFIKPYYTGLSDRYTCKSSDKYIIYLSAQNFNNLKLSNFPNLFTHFNKYKAELKNAKIKYKTPDKPYYYLHRERDEIFFIEGKAKIISQGRTLFPRFYYTENSFYASRALFVIQSKRFNLKFLTAILNSTLIRFWLRHKGKMQGNNFQVDKEPLLAIPLVLVPEIEQAPFISLADQMLETQSRLQQALSDEDKKLLAKRAEILDEQIDKAVYQLYGLTEEEIKIVEGR